ncbi:hypothetical protein RhiirA5_445872, partial [Rhizophagus irregularis]
GGKGREKGIREGRKSEGLRERERKGKRKSEGIGEREGKRKLERAKGIKDLIKRRFKEKRREGREQRDA